MIHHIVVGRMSLNMVTRHICTLDCGYWVKFQKNWIFPGFSHFSCKNIWGKACKSSLIWRTTKVFQQKPASETSVHIMFSLNSARLALMLSSRRPKSSKNVFLLKGSCKSVFLLSLVKSSGICICIAIVFLCWFVLYFLFSLTLPYLNSIPWTFLSQPVRKISTSVCMKIKFLDPPLPHLEKGQNFTV